YPYDGSVLIVDAIINTPGMAGGALVDLEGRLVGVICNPVISHLPNTWLNYALPVEQIRGFVAHGPLPAPAHPARAAADASDERPYLGIRLFELGGRLKPAYIDRVRPRSPAKKAGVRKNDLIVAIDGDLIATCSDYHERLAELVPGREIQITVKRKNALKTLTLTVGSKTQVKRP
ncbi:MAG: serine protease, partial [Planctomycetes bacterium]|nr:serine protease [Planctomycetota bacterium]